MTAREFLELLLPSTGFIFTATPSPAGRGWFNTCHASLDDALAHVNRLTFEGQPAYFALATYEKERVWNPTIKNADGTVGRWVQRTQENAQSIRSFFLDLDVDAQDKDKFASKQEALTELRDFTRKLGLPRPLLVDSGGGIHAYWPLVHPVGTVEWRGVADTFKAICVAQRFRADRSLTADQARVLRCPGGFNFKRGSVVRVLATAPPITFAAFADTINRFAQEQGTTVSGGKPRATSLAPLPGKPVDPFEAGNIGATNDPLNFDQITFSCPQLQVQVATRGEKTGEQLWRAALGVVKFCEPMPPAAWAVSDAHPDFTPEATLQKIENWHTGPTACSHFHSLNPAPCEGCAHWQKITSPAVLGRTVVAQSAPQVTVVADNGMPVTLTLPDPPRGYSRRAADNAIVIQIEDEEGRTSYEVVCPYDLYPLTLRAQNGLEANIDERSMWRVHLPIERGRGREARDIDVPLALMSDLKGLTKHLFSKGVILNGDQPKLTQHYMSAYLQKLADEAGREKLYERLGWHDEHQTFVMGDRMYRRSGQIVPHTASPAIRNTTRSGLKQAGTLAGWQAAMEFYNRPGFEGHRFFVYAALGAPIFHMNDTGNRGVLMTASGQSGRGKTTCLKACGSLWGHPEALYMNGNKDGSTVNLLYNAIGTVHSLPFLWDDITERDPDEIRRFLLNISQGQGKRRMTADAQASERIDTWETIVLATANTDDISRILSSGRDVNPHLMRLVGVEFGAIDTGAEAKVVADEFIRQIGSNYGHVGPAMLRVLVPQYEVIRKGYIKNVAMVDRMLGSSNASAERYWSATVAAAYTGAQIASKMGLIRFPFEQDLQWMVDHLGQQRETIKESSNGPLEMLTQFLNSNLRGTLIIGSKASSNLDNVVQKPTDSLIIRNELDGHVIYVSRAAVMEFCAEHRMAFKQFENQLEHERAITNRNAQKVLGAETVFASGQTRCWKIDATKLGGVVATQAAAAAQAPTPTNVIQIGGRR